MATRTRRADSEAALAELLAADSEKANLKPRPGDPAGAAGSASCSGGGGPETRPVAVVVEGQRLGQLQWWWRASNSLLIARAGLSIKSEAGGGVACIRMMC